MNAIAVRLVARIDAPLPPAAWFVPGRDARVWLDEVLRLGCAELGTRLLVVPTSRRDRTPCGLLVLPGAAVAPSAASRALPYACRAERVFHPCGAELSPPITDGELDDLLTTDLAVWHPVVGLVGVARDDVLGVGDLFALAPPQPLRWDLAEAGTVVVGRLLAVEPDAPPETATMFVEEQRSIGNKPLRELPPSRLERPVAPHAEFARAIAQWLARVLAALLRLAPRTAPGRTWVNRLEEWALARSGDSRRDAQAREREIARLLAMLHEDPDRGLQHALPIGGLAGRGFAPPGNRLGTRSVNFDARRLGGGAPVDAWQIEWEQRRRLQERYRELATAAIAAGQHRRAAYIFAHLLGDLRAAAATLSDGGFAREAAVLYAERLNDPLAAANCLVKAGLLGEAADFYETLRQHENAGDLRLVLRQPEAATAQYRLALQQRLERGDALGAALLQIEKLQEIDAGLQLLEQAWRGDRRQATCLAAQLAVLHRLQREDELARVLRVSAGERPGPRAWRVEVAVVIAQTSARWPIGGVRDLACDLVRRIGSELLSSVDGKPRERLLQSIRNTAGDDELLARDVQRYANANAPKRRREPASIGLQLTLLGSYPLPPGARWSAACMNGSDLFVVGSVLGEHGQPEPARGCIAARWSPHLPAHWRTFRLPARARTPAVELHKTGSLLLVYESMTGNGLDLCACAESLPSNSGRVPGWPEGVLGIGSDGSSSLWLVRRHGYELLLELRDAVVGALLASHSLPVLVDPEQVQRVPVAIVRGTAVVGLGNHVVLRAPDGAVTTLEVGSPVRSLSAANRFLRPQVLIGLELGFALLDMVGKTHTVHRYLEDWQQPVVGFQDGARVIAIGASMGRVFEASGGELRPGSEFALPDEGPFVISPGIDAAHALLVSRSRVHVARFTQGK